MASIYSAEGIAKSIEGLTAHISAFTYDVEIQNKVKEIVAVCPKCRTWRVKHKVREDGCSVCKPNVEVIPAIKETTKVVSEKEVKAAINLVKNQIKENRCTLVRAKKNANVSPKVWKAIPRNDREMIEAMVRAYYKPRKKRVNYSQEFKKMIADLSLKKPTREIVDEYGISQVNVSTWVRLYHGDDWKEKREKGKQWRRRKR